MGRKKKIILNKMFLATEIAFLLFREGNFSQDEAKMYAYDIVRELEKNVNS